MRLTWYRYHTERYRTRPDSPVTTLLRSDISNLIYTQNSQIHHSNPDLPSATRWHVEPTLTRHTVHHGEKLPLRANYSILNIGKKWITADRWATTERKCDPFDISRPAVRSIEFRARVDTAGGQFVTLEPKVQYLYTQHQQQNDIGIYDATEMLNDFHGLFRGRQYTGLDRIDHNDQITVGMTSRLFNANDQEVLSLSAGQIFKLINMI